MILTHNETSKFEEAARPLIKWLNENRHPHVIAIVDTGSAELHEAVCRIVDTDYIKD